MELLDILRHLPAGWALIFLALAVLIMIVALLMYVTTPPKINDDGGR